MLDTRIEKAKKAARIQLVFTLIGVIVLLLGYANGWIMQAVVIALSTRVIYGWVVVNLLKREQDLSSM